jgi:hypothetical protein
LRHPSNQPAVWFESNAATPVRYGHIVGLVGGMQLNVEDATDAFTFLVNSVERFRVDNTGADITGGLAVVGALSAAATSLTGMLTVNPAVGNECIRVRSSTPEITLFNEAGTSEYGHIVGTPSGAGLVSTNDVVFTTNSSTVAMSIVGSSVFIGKAASSLAVGGVELLGGTGAVFSTVDTNTPNVILNRQGGGNVDGGIFASFRNANSVKGSITWDTGTSKVVYNETSDYRLKNDLGPVVGGVERIKLLRPRRITRKDSTAPVEHDAFIAHEVAEVMPELVTGVKDAVAGPPVDDGDPAEGTIVPQQLNYQGLITVTIAALQDALTQIETLTTRIEALEGGGAPA